MSQLVERILVVDDEDSVRTLLVQLLELRGFECEQAEHAARARELLAEQEFALLLCDMNMPGELGIDLIRFVCETYPNTASVMVTAQDSHEIAETALRVGAYGYVIKPFELNEILINVTSALRRRELEIENRNHREKLEEEVALRTQDLRDAVHSLEKAQVELKTAQEETVVRLAKAAEFRDNETAQHIHRMSQYCAILARSVGLSEEECEFIRLTSSMHDVGKIGTPDQILLKRGKLTDEEFEIMKEHAEIGYRILVGSGSKILEMAATIAWTHHERIDGNGYPNGLMGDEIPIEGRIATIADVFDALTSKRVYKPAFSVEKALEIMSEGLGTQFDQELFGLFRGALDEVLEIKERFADL